MSTNVYSVILAGGMGTRLMNLTKARAKPSIRFAGYNLLEIMINLCNVAGFDKIDVYTEHRTDSMFDTIRAWDQEIGGRGWVRNFHTQGTLLEGLTRGSGDALYEMRERRAELKRDYNIDDQDVFLVLGADHVTDLDLEALVQSHVDRDNDVTLAVAKVRRERAANSLGVVVTDDDGRVIKFMEKPPLEEIPSLPGDEEHCLANTANLVYRPRILEDSVTRYFDTSATAYDQSKHILTPLVEDSARSGMKIRVYVHEGYWSDVGEIDSLFDANMDLVKVVPDFDLYHMAERTQAMFKSPGALYRGQPLKVNWGGELMGSIGMNGTIVSGEVRGSVLSYGVRVEREARVEKAVLFDRVFVGELAEVRDAIVDKNVIIGEGAVVDPSVINLNSSANRVTLIGPNRDHVLIQRSWNGDMEFDGRGFVSGITMMPLHGEEHGSYAEAVLTPRKRLVMSKFSYVPPGETFGA